MHINSRIYHFGRCAISAYAARQWMMRTDQGLTRTEVKPRWVWTTCSFARATDPQHAKATLNFLDFQSGAVFAAMVVKEGVPYALAVALEAAKFTGRTRLIIMSDQENAVKNLVDMIRDSRTHETAVISTPKGSSASAGGIERANYEVEKQIRTLRSRF